MTQNPNPSKLQLSQPRSSYDPSRGKEMLVFWGSAILVIIVLILIMKGLFQKK
jgi:hypothetical protein